MKEKYYKASITVETTYISVFLFFSILFLVYFTLSTYNVSILTSKSYYILESYVSEEINEEVEEGIFGEAYEASKCAGIFNGEMETKVKTEFDQLSIDYNFESFSTGIQAANELFQNTKWEYGIQTSCNRERIQESMFLMKGISDSVSEGIDVVVECRNLE